jgi:hypothetical protein
MRSTMQRFKNMEPKYRGLDVEGNHHRTPLQLSQKLLDLGLMAEHGCRR